MGISSYEEGFEVVSDVELFCMFLIVNEIDGNFLLISKDN